jgi:hypothetical protein
MWAFIASHPISVSVLAVIVVVYVGSELLGRYINHRRMIPAKRGDKK